MIIERFPELLQLTPDQQLMLAAELFEKVTDCGAEEPDPEIVRLLDARAEEYRKDLARISHTFRASRQRNSPDTRRAPISAVGGINIPCDAGIKRNAVAVEFRKDSPKGYEKSGLVRPLNSTCILTHRRSLPFQPSSSI